MVGLVATPLVVFAGAPAGAAAVYVAGVHNVAFVLEVVTAAGAGAANALAGLATGNGIVSAVGGALASGGGIGSAIAGAAGSGAAVGATTAITSGSAMAAATAVASSTASTIGSSACLTAVFASPLGWALVGADGYTWDCWKPVIIDDSVEPSRGITLRDLWNHPNIQSMTFDNEHLIAENIRGERFCLSLVDVNGVLAFHAIAV